MHCFLPPINCLNIREYPNVYANDALVIDWDEHFAQKRFKIKIAKWSFHLFILVATVLLVITDDAQVVNVLYTVWPFTASAI